MNRASFLTAITIAISAPSPDAAAQAPFVRADTILLERARCSGSCPQYPVSIAKSGKVLVRTSGSVGAAEDSTVRHRHVGLGLGLGFVIGTVAGMAIEAAGKHGEDRTLSEVGGAIGGALVGTIIGGTVGFFWRTGK